MRRMIVAAALAAASLSFGMAPAWAAVTNPPDPGTFSLGVDIAGLPLDPTDVHNFLSGLDPQTRAGVEGACTTYQRYPDSADSVQTLHFCAEINHPA